MPETVIASDATALRFDGRYRSLAMETKKR
ncbi:hypothetical protein AB7M49_003182 [Bradyrhizobium elkanii]